MIRAGGLAGLLFLAAGLVWAVLDPVLASREVQALATAGAGCEEAQAALRRRQNGSIWALRKGLERAEEPTQLHCARLLALQRDDACERVLFEVLSRGEADPLSLLAGHLLLTVWDRRNGPAPEAAARLLREPPEGRAAENAALVELSGLLKLHSAWSGGYVARARLQLRRNKVQAAAEDALYALRWEPGHFEALELLGRCYLAMDYPEVAQERLERALQINPRLYPQIQEDLRTARRHASAEREQRAIERLRELPVL